MAIVLVAGVVRVVIVAVVCAARSSSSLPLQSFSSFFSSFFDSSLAMLGDCADGGATIGTALDPGFLGSILLRHHFWNPLPLSLGPRGCLITLGFSARPEAAYSICPEILRVIHPGNGCMGCIMPNAGSIMKAGAEGCEGLDKRRCCIVKIGAFGFSPPAFCGCSADMAENFMLCIRETFLLGGAPSEAIIIWAGIMPWL